MARAREIELLYSFSVTALERVHIPRAVLHEKSAHARARAYSSRCVAREKRACSPQTEGRKGKESACVAVGVATLSSHQSVFVREGFWVFHVCFDQT